MSPIVIGPATKVLVYISFLLLGLWCWFQWKYRRQIRVASKMYPGKYFTLPFLGHGLLLAFKWDRVSEWIMDAVKDALAKGKTTVCLWCGPLPLPVVLGVEDIQKILNSSNTSEKLDEMKYMDYAMGHGILIASKNVWRTKRRHLNPLFHPRNVEQMMPTFNQNSREMILKLSKHVDGDTFNILDQTMKSALKSICNLLFGKDVTIDTESEEFQGLLTAVERVPELFIKRVIRPWLRISFIFQFIYKKEISTLTTTWTNFTDGLLKEARKNKSLRKQTDLISEIGPELSSESLSKGPLTILDVYSTLQMQCPNFSEKELIDEVVTLYCTGTDPVGGTVATSLLLLAYYQTIQTKLYEEISSVMKEDEDVTTDHLNRMPYLDQVYKETLRWSTIVPFIGRKASEDLKLSSCTIQAGSTVILGLAAVHLDPNIYPNPDQFDPDRFSEEKLTENGKSAFVAFSGGPRSCIGKAYTHLMIKTMMVHLLKEFNFTTSMNIHKMKKKLKMIYISSEGYNVKIEKRKQERKTKL